MLIMDSLIHADIFFFITTIAVIVLALLVAVLLGTGIAILWEVRSIARRTRREVERVFDGIHAVGEVVEEGMKGGFHAARRGLREGAETMRSYAETVREAGGGRGVLLFLLETIRELREQGLAEKGAHHRAEHARSRQTRKSRTGHARRRSVTLDENERVVPRSDTPENETISEAER